MSSLLLPTSSALSQSISILECGPCAVGQWLRTREAPWTPASADFAADLTAAALLLGGAAEVLVPYSLVQFMEAERQQTQCRPETAAMRSTWAAAVSTQKVAVLVGCTDGIQLLASPLAEEYKRLCVAVPGGPLISKLSFRQTIDSFYHNSLPSFIDAAVALNGVQWRAWMRSSLTCQFEGSFVPPLRVMEDAAQLLQQCNNCNGVMLEEGISGLTPRWLETAAKTAAGNGIPASSLGLALHAERSDVVSRLLHKAVEVGVVSWASCSLANSPLFDHTGPMPSLADVQCFANGWNDAAMSLGPKEEEALVRCTAFVEAANEKWQSMQ